jgi:hypothetical protein
MHAHAEDAQPKLNGLVKKLSVAPAAEENSLEDAAIYRAMNIAFWSLELSFCYIQPWRQIKSLPRRICNIVKIVLLLVAVLMCTFLLVLNIIEIASGWRYGNRANFKYGET